MWNNKFRRIARIVRGKIYKKNGKGKTDNQRYRCKTCQKSFQLTYRYAGHQPGIKSKIEAQRWAGAGSERWDETHLKRLSPKTICFSKSELIHDNVIALYINRFCFHVGTFAQALKTTA